MDNMYCDICYNLKEENEKLKDCFEKVFKNGIR